MLNLFVWMHCVFPHSSINLSRILSPSILQVVPHEARLGCVFIIFSVVPHVDRFGCVRRIFKAVPHVAIKFILVDIKLISRPIFAIFCQRVFSIYLFIITLLVQ